MKSSRRQKKASDVRFSALGSVFVTEEQSMAHLWPSVVHSRPMNGNIGAVSISLTCLCGVKVEEKDSLPRKRPNDI